ncbi:MAG TPA: hypothetical protein VHC69_09460 [Polyangiaceae bacterium]|nr:hypothetical protein [Polyangiaceae bacterium]
MALSVAPNAAVSALAGVRAASARLNKAAANVAAASLPQEDTVTISDGARAAAAQGGDTSSHDIASAMIDLRVARYQNAASIAVLRTSDEVTEDALKIGKPENQR